MNKVSRCAVHLLLFSIALTLSGAPMVHASTVSSNYPDTNPQNVAFHLELIDLTAINSVQQSFDANLYYELEWRDTSLVNNETTPKIMDLGEVWHPNVQIRNQRRLQFTLPEEVTVFPDGRVQYRQRASGNFSQRFQLKKFPFDTQTIDLILVPAGFEPGQLNLIVKESSGVVPEFSLPDWTVMSWEVRSETVNSGIEAIDWDQVVLSVEVRRHYGFYLAKILLPLVLIVFMSWTVFWLDPSQTGPQISVSITAMLTLIAFRFSMTSMLPSISILTKLDWFLLHATFLIFLGLIEVVYTSWLANNGELSRARQIDRISRLIFPLLFVLAVLHAFIWN